MDIGYIFIFLGLSFLSSLASRNSAIGMINSLGISSSHYPKWYVAPARWVRSLFKLTQRSIPRFLYFELFLSLFFAALGPINIAICVLAHGSKKIAGILIMLHIILVIAETVCLSVFAYLMKKK